MNFRSQLSIFALAAALAAPVGFAQQVMPPSSPAAGAKAADAAIVAPPFDVISVKPNKGAHGTAMRFTPDGLRATGATVRFLLYEGYGGINSNQVLNEPAWAATDSFDIEAKVLPADVPTLAKMTFEQRRTMFQAILVERFKLAVHHETRVMPVYVLTVAKGGPKFKETAPDDAATTTPRRRGTMVNNGKITSTDAQLSTLVTILSRRLGRTVVDKTGLTGNYDFTLEYADDDVGSPSPPPDSSAAGVASTPDSRGSIFTALQEQMGLKLESTKAPVDVVVIDHIEKPTEN
jgi:uncharacterized protein (TIGR03435 family)